MIELRDYQQALIADIRTQFRSMDRTVLVQLATGGGKTVTSAYMVKTAAERGRRCWWVVHRREIILQASRTFWSMEIPHSLVMGGSIGDRDAMVQVGSVQTLSRRLGKLPAPDLIIFDECHHMGAAQYQQIYEACPRAQIIGLTATPWRLDGRGLGAWFESMVQGPSVADLMERGALCDYRLYAPTTTDVASVAMQGGDFKREDLARVMDKPSIVGDAVQHYQRLAAGKRAIVFAVSIEHSRNIAAQFQAAGIPSAHVDGSMDSGARDAIVADFSSGAIQVLSNADLFGEGFDVPAVEAVILLRPTQSLSLHLQQIGRGLRPAAGKPHAIVLDHAGNAMRHGLPDDDREWSLEDRPKKKRGAKSEVPVKQCPTCFLVHSPAPECPGCGHAYAVQSREIEQVEGELEVVDLDAIRARKRHELKSARTLEQLIELGKQRRYKYPTAWAGHIMRQRQQWRAGA
ncbi:DEAD/DEAH box helicase [Sphingomonas abaci]|uniref:Superfamily II DNA or RNA helicase n=1 Tax=Sphingomonas abaci TaxID=237611 RepID=A0A7W7AIP5_9SPHN|nr:DEAD/DEAH box helicase [Sphingomonas abaci]MBB4616935.1 superfamily II DNA or RNA helicase [Sphingomonas abaci]